MTSDSKSIRDWVAENAANPKPLSPAELAARLDVDAARVHEAASRLRRRGKIPRPTRAEPSSWAPPPDFFAHLEREPEMSTQDRAKALARIARGRGVPHAVRVMALKALGDEHVRITASPGPSASLTDEERMDRMVRLIAAVGAAPWKEAISRYEALRDVRQCNAMQ